MTSFSSLNAIPKEKISKKNKALYFAIQYSFKGNFDPIEQNYINLQFLFRSIYSTLFKLDSHLRINPLILEKYEKKGKSVIFYLKEGARFSDGSPITVEDILHSIESGMAYAESPNPVYKLIEGGEALFQGKTPHCAGINILSPNSLEIKLKDENAEFEYYFTANNMAILPHHRNKQKKINEMIFSGPFQVASFQLKQKQSIVTLKKNSFYFDQESKLDTILIRFYFENPEFERVINMGWPDVFLYSQGLKFPYFKQKYNYFKTPSFGAFYIKLNPLKGPFKDKNLRTFFKNVILSLDLVENEKWELTAPCKMILPYSLTGYFVFDSMVPGNFQKTIPKNEIKINCLNPDYGIRQTLLPILKKKLKKYNLELELNWTKSMGEVKKHERQGNIDLTTYYYMVDIPLSSYFYESLFTPGLELNLSGVKVPAAMELLGNYRKENDEFKKLRILSQLESTAQDEAYLIPLMNPLFILGYKDYVKNVKIDKFLQINFEDIDVEYGY